MVFFRLMHVELGTCCRDEMDPTALFLPARDPVLKDQVLNGNITHSKHGRVTRKKEPVLNGECIQNSFFPLVT